MIERGERKRTAVDVSKASSLSGTNALMMRSRSPRALIEAPLVSQTPIS
jgi:hypothetical protein